MKLQLIFITLMCVRNSQHAQVKHEHISIVACSDRDDKEAMYGMDGDEYLYADFVKGEGVNMLPPFAEKMDTPGFYEQAQANMDVCKTNLQMVISAMKEPVAQDAPQSSIYSRSNVQVGTENILICHFDRFFPPSVRVNWTKNGKDVTDSASFSQYYPNEDGTYNQFSHLSFTPKEGDIYTCTVEHSALQNPDTKTWEVDVKLPSIGPAVFCGVGLVVGLLGVAIGTFFLIKGNQCN